MENAKTTLNDIRTKAGKGEITCLPLNLKSFKSAREFAEKVNSNHDKIDLLINIGMFYILHLFFSHYSIRCTLHKNFIKTFHAF